MRLPRMSTISMVTASGIRAWSAAPNRELVISPSLMRVSWMAAMVRSWAVKPSSSGRTSSQAESIPDFTVVPGVWA